MYHRIILLDTYALPTYIPLIGSPFPPKPFYDDTADHPVRYLTIGPLPFAVSSLPFLLICLVYSKKHAGQGH